jgi:LysM repeat protein
VVSLALVAVVFVRPAAAEIQARVRVKSGQTLSAIAKRYDCTVEALQHANDLDGTTIQIGQRLAVPVCKHRPAANKPRTARVAKEIAPAPVETVRGQSIGKPWSGHLRRATRMPKGKGYLIRRPYRAFGTAHLVGHLRDAIVAVREDHPRLHTLAIGDLSAQGGGSITEHRSHQSGRDVDVGFFYKRKPAAYPNEFVVATAANLDRAATWDLLVAFARTADEPDGVQAIFLDYDVQGLLYDWAAERGVDEAYLGRLFQYPDGKGGGTGLVRHEPHHDDHFHVRFKCPAGDTACQ